jgi:proline dehydrogenase
MMSAELAGLQHPILDLGSIGVGMGLEYGELLNVIALRYAVTPEQVDERVSSRRKKVFGLVGRRLAARSVQASLAMTAAEQRLSNFLASSARHVSGLNIEDAIAAARHERERGRQSTLGYWPQPNEAPVSIANHYLRAVEAIDATGPSRLDSSISIKVDQLGFDHDLVVQVLQYAKQHRVRVHFDAQGYDTTDRTLAFIELGVAMGADVSGTLPSRWRRSSADAERFIQWGIPMRIVKGQGADPTEPKIDPRRSYLELVEQLAGRASHVGVATHDRRTAEAALDRLLAAGTPCSLEQLRSLPRLDFLAAGRGVPVRAYIAFGRFGLPYSVGEFMRRPAILGWILRDLAVRHRPSQRSASAR